MKTRLLIIGLLYVGVATLQSQTIDLGFVAVGGSFSDPADKPRLIAIDLDNNEVLASDTLSSNSLQDLELDNTESSFGELYLTAQDSIIKYAYDFTSFGFQLNKLERSYFPRIGKIDLVEDVLFAGRFFGDGPYLFGFDKFNLTDTLYVSNNINATYQDLTALNDSTVVVAYNVKGTVDVCAPFGCFADSLAMLEIINTNTWEAETINLGEDKAGKISILANPSLELNGVLLVITPKDGSVNLVSVDTGLLISESAAGVTDILSEESNVEGTMKVLIGDSLGIANVSGSSSGFSFSSTKLIKSSSKNFVNQSSFSDNKFYGLNTDFASFGELVINTTSSSDTIQVGVSPEDFVTTSLLVSGVKDVFNSNNFTKTYLSDDLVGITFNDFVLIDAYGNNYGSYQELESVDFSSLSSALYVLKGLNGETIRIIKK